MNTTRPVILDSDEFNPRFVNELRAVCKKDPSFRDVYDKIVYNFLADYKVVTSKDWMQKYIKVISRATTVHVDKDNAYSISKFRVKSKGKGSSESPRIWIASVPSLNVVIPLSVYTHGDADTKNEPTLASLEKTMKLVLKAYKEYLQDPT